MTEELDLRGEVCPYTFVKTKLKLEEMATGGDLTIHLDDPEAVANVSKSLRNEGHDLKELKSISPGVWMILVRKGKDPRGNSENWTETAINAVQTLEFKPNKGR